MAPWRADKWATSEVAIAIGCPWPLRANPKPRSKPDNNKVVARPARFKAPTEDCFDKAVGDGIVMNDAVKVSFGWSTS